MTDETPPAKPRRKAGRPLGDTIGGILVGFDQQIMRTLPPPHELVHKGSPVRGLSGEGDDLVIELPPRADDGDGLRADADVDGGPETSAD